jgi:iron-sulfur cluster repair protein YtfE (RIC family)
MLRAAVQTHAQIEEEILFPALERAGLTNGPLTVMRAEHREIDELLSAIAAAKDLAGAQDGAARLLALLRAHFRKEELLLFPMVGQALAEGELSELGQRWSGERGVPCG